jgi:hypothetical protein
MDGQNETNSCNQHHTKKAQIPTVKEARWAILDEYGDLLHPLGFKPQTIQPIASHYANYANQLDIYTYTIHT